MTDATSPQIIYVGSWSRSGTTLVANVLAELSGVFDAGEVVALPDFFERGFDGTTCGCGRHHADCDLWAAVWSEFQSLSPRNRTGRLAEDRQRFSRVRPQQLYRLLRASPTGPASAYAQSVADLYRAIATVTGAKIIVDNSKGMARALLAARLAGVDMAVLHVVRHPAAIAFSWRRRAINRAEFSPISSSLRWLISNLGWEWFSRAHPQIPFVQMRYEDFVDQPRETVEKIADALGLPGHSSPFSSKNEIWLSGNHTAAGNMSRFNTGAITVTPDVAWRSQIRAADLAVALVPAVPLLWRYRYAPKGTLAPGLTPRRRQRRSIDGAQRLSDRTRGLLGRALHARRSQDYAPLPGESCADAGSG